MLSRIEIFKFITIEYEADENCAGNKLHVFRAFSFCLQFYIQHRALFYHEIYYSGY